MAGPEKEYRVGGIKATVWKNEFEGKETFKVSVTKSYKDKNDEWKETNQFTLNECLKLVRLLENAFDDFAFAPQNIDITVKK